MSGRLTVPRHGHTVLTPGGECMRGRTLRTGLLAATIALLTVAGCAPTAPHEPEPTIGQPPLQGTSWRLEALGTSGNMRPALTTTDVSLSFLEDSRVSGNASCNSYFGQYVASDGNGTLTVSGLGSTKMFCNEPGVMQQEQDFLNTLGAAEHYSVEEGLLHISGGDMELVFSRA
jgi:heat shock protein HslJ